MVFVFGFYSCSELAILELNNYFELDLPGTSYYVTKTLMFSLIKVFVVFVFAFVFMSMCVYASVFLNKSFLSFIGGFPGLIRIIHITSTVATASGNPWMRYLHRKSIH